MGARYDENEGYWVDMCGKCGTEGPLREGDIEACISLHSGAMILQLCRQCRETTTVEQALELLAQGPRPKRISLMDQVAALASRVEALDGKFGRFTVRRRRSSEKR